MIKFGDQIENMVQGLDYVDHDTIQYEHWREEIIPRKVEPLIIFKFRNHKAALI